MTGFTVDVSQLTDVGRILSDASVALSAGTQEELHLGSSLGSSRVEAALGEFAGRWRRGVAELADSADTAARLVSDAARRYGGVEAQLLSAMRGPG